MTEISIKNMVCDRCIRLVREELASLGFKVVNVELGKAIVDQQLERPDRERIAAVLHNSGFELLEDRKAQLVDQIKTIIIKLIYGDQLENLKENISDILAREIGRNYQYLSTLFSSVMGVTIERYVIVQKIERVKELMTYNELTISEIAYRLGYSSVQHLSNQFRTVTGLSPTHFKKLRSESRKPLDQVL
ncbi:MAG: helix-turn-helix domain-containing protein [Fidelibacterota bacterium]|nr:MAG: helix-turn-helix domain-containing protein [Candidatus Neomarinimicrobiota bacterium]